MSIFSGHTSTQKAHTTLKPHSYTLQYPRAGSYPESSEATPALLVSLTNTAYNRLTPGKTNIAVLLGRLSIGGTIEPLQRCGAWCKWVKARGVVSVGLLQCGAGA